MNIIFKNSNIQPIQTATGIVESWKPIPNYPNYYISNFGRVVSTKRNTPIIIQPTESDRGYLLVDLYYQGERHRKRLARLVAAVWGTQDIKGKDVHHKNLRKQCNCIFNLQPLDHIQHCKLHQEMKRSASDISKPAQSNDK